LVRALRPYSVSACATSSPVSSSVSGAARAADTCPSRPRARTARGIISAGRRADRSHKTCHATIHPPSAMPRRCTTLRARVSGSSTQPARPICTTAGYIPCLAFAFPCTPGRALPCRALPRLTLYLRYDDLEKEPRWLQHKTYRVGSSGSSLRRAGIRLDRHGATPPAHHRQPTSAAVS